MTIKMRINNATGRGDIVMGDRGIATDGSLETVAQCIAYTDRTANKNDAIPDGSTNRRGWWGDVLNRDGFKLGCRLWLLENGKATNTNRRLAEDFLKEGFEPLVIQGAAEATRTREVGLARGRGDVIALATEFLEPSDAAPQWRRYWMEFDLGLA